MSSAAHRYSRSFVAYCFLKLCVIASTSGVKRAGRTFGGSFFIVRSVMPRCSSGDFWIFRRSSVGRLFVTMTKTHGMKGTTATTLGSTMSAEAAL